VSTSIDGSSIRQTHPGSVAAVTLDRPLGTTLKALR